jgi:hypothetical protein
MYRALGRLGTRAWPGWQTLTQKGGCSLSELLQAKIVSLGSVLLYNTSLNSIILLSSLVYEYSMLAHLHKFLKLIRTVAPRRTVLIHSQLHTALFRLSFRLLHICNCPLSAIVGRPEPYGSNQRWTVLARYCELVALDVRLLWGVADTRISPATATSSGE